MFVICFSFHYLLVTHPNNGGILFFVVDFSNNHQTVDTTFHAQGGIAVGVVFFMITESFDVKSLIYKHYRPILAVKLCKSQYIISGVVENVIAVVARSARE